MSTNLVTKATRAKIAAMVEDGFRVWGSRFEIRDAEAAGFRWFTRDELESRRCRLLDLRGQRDAIDQQRKIYGDDAVHVLRKLTRGDLTVDDARFYLRMIDESRLLYAQESELRGGSLRFSAGERYGLGFHLICEAESLDELADELAKRRAKDFAHLNAPAAKTKKVGRKG